MAETTLADRYNVTLSEYKGKLYLHIKDTTKTASQVSLHADAVLDLAKNLPKIVSLVKDFQGEKTEVVEEEEPVVKKKAKRGRINLDDVTSLRRQ